MIKRITRYTFLLGFGASCLAVPTTAPLLLDEESPVIFYANEQSYDGDLGILVLRGNVEFAQNGEVLEANYVTYNENTDTVTASGNVRMRRPDGTIAFSEYLELKDDMKEGFVKHVRVLMEDDSRIAAVETRREGVVDTYDKAAYTPCKICSLGDTPTWQLNAQRLVKDNDENYVYLTDAHMEFLGVPVMYFPYMFHPTKRKSGLLRPSVSHSEDKGFQHAQPVYFVFDDNSDMTITPVFHSERPTAFAAQHRHLFSFGDFEIEGSATKRGRNYKHEKGDKRTALPDTRGHTWSKGNFSLNEDWRFRGEGGWVSDQTYFKKYNLFGHKSKVSLDSKAHLEGFWDRDYAATHVYHFQSLEKGVRQKHVADALPYMEYKAYSGQDRLGGRFAFDANFLELRRIEGRKLQRGITEIGWQAPYVSPWGQVLTVFGSGRVDVFSVHDSPFKTAGVKNNVKNEATARGYTQGGAEVSWPFIAFSKVQSTVFEPLVQLIAAPRGVNKKSLPNEDSVGFEFTDTNLFARDRIPGYDTIDDGSRANYGMRVISQGKAVGRWEGFLGQSFNFNEANPMYKMQGLDHRSSDIVGYVKADPIENWLSAHYRFRADRGNMEVRFSEWGGYVGPPIFRVSADHVFISQKAGAPDSKDFKQINVGISSQFAEQWSAKAGARYDLAKHQKHDGKLEQSIGIQFKDDCFTSDFVISRQFYQDRDLRPNTTFMFILAFKNLGTISKDFNLADLTNDRDKKDASLGQ